MRFGPIWLILVACLWGCSSGSSSPDDGSGGRIDGPSGGGQLDTAPSGGQALNLSCADACKRVLGFCPSISDIWVDVCTSSCENKLKIRWELAKTETDCILAAQDCTTATLCAKDLH
jgi:hypothetical protein